MKILILGAGQVGSSAAYHLSREEANEVTVVDMRPEVLRELQDRLDIGADYRDESGKSAGSLDFFGFLIPTDFKLDRGTTGLFASLSASPGDRLLLQGSARYDDADGFDKESSFAIGASYDLKPGMTVSANWGEAFKLPSFFALGHALVGNAELRPERATNWDLGITWERDEKFHLDATYFSNEFNDLVDFDPDEFRNINRKNIETSGIELQVVWQPLPQLNLQARTTYTKIDSKAEDTVLTGRPEWVAGALAEWQFHENWDTAIDYQYTGEQWAASRHTTSLLTAVLDDYHTLDWVLRWKPSRDWTVTLSADNVLNKHYHTAIGFPAAGRSFRLSLRYAHASENALNND